MNKDTTSTKCVAIIAVCFLSIANCHAEQNGSIWLSIGNAPDSKGGGTGIALGVAGKEGFSVVFGAIIDSNSIGGYLSERDPPPSNLTVQQKKGTYQIRPTWGFDILYLITIGTVQPYAGIGLYSSKFQEIAKYSDGMEYGIDKEKFSLAGELGLRAVIAEDYILGIGYHSLRGGNISFGKAF